MNSICPRVRYASEFFFDSASDISTWLRASAYLCSSISFWARERWESLRFAARSFFSEEAQAPLTTTRTIASRGTMRPRISTENFIEQHFLPEPLQLDAAQGRDVEVVLDQLV